MRRERGWGKSKFPILLGVLGLSWGTAGAADGSADPGNYRRLLKAAHGLLEHRKARAELFVPLARVEASSRILAKLGLGASFFEPGEQWVVAVSRLKSSLGDARASRHQPPGYSRPVEFVYRVLSVDGDKARIEVRPNGSGAARPRRISHAVFVLSRHYEILEKTHYFTDGRAPAVNLSFDPMPLVLPRFGLASARVIESGAIEFEDHDMLGRKIEVIWNKGDVWPTLVRSPSQVIQLVKAEKRSGT